MTHCNLRTVLSTTLQIISADEWLRRQSAITQFLSCGIRVVTVRDRYQF